MSTLHAVPTDLETVALTGWLLPGEGTAVDPAEVRDDLRALGLLGTVEAGSLAAGEPCLVVLLGTPDERVLTLREGKVVPGRDLADLGPELARMLGGTLEIEEHEFSPHAGPELALADGAEDEGGCCGGGCCGGTAEETDQDAGQLPGHPDVVAFRGGSELWPLLARTAGTPVTALAADGWSVVNLEDTFTDLSEHAWLGSELPLVHLFRVEDDRFIQVRTDARIDAEEHLLAPLPAVLPTFSTAEVSDERAGWLTSPHLLPDSAARAVAGARAFAHVDLAELAGVLDQPCDGRWSARVLDLLGLPTLVADLHEGRVSPAGGTWVEPAGLLRAGWDMARFYEDAPAEEVRRRGPVGRFYGLTRQRPDIAAGVLVAKTALAAGLLAAGRRRDSRALRALGWSGAAEVALDAALVLRQVLRRR